MRKALFMDRDGTVIEHVHYINDPGNVRLVMPAAEKMREFQENGYLIIIITNQSGIARGKISRQQYEAVNFRMLELLGKEGVKVDAVFMCPSHPDANDFRRKPNPGMLLEAAEKFKVSLRDSLMVGDDEKDLEAGRRAGAKALSVADFLRTRP